MAIEFKCSTCGKELFAQDHYAGMRTTCPGCQTKLIIPPPGGLAAAAAALAENTARESEPASDLNARPIDTLLVDMEKIPPHVPAKKAELIAPDPAAADTPGATPEPVKRCPYCAEKVLAAALKCRFCGEYFDDEVKRRSTLEKRRRAAEAALQTARTSEAIFRGAGRLMTMLTAGWLMTLTFQSAWYQLHPSAESGIVHAPWTLYLFNVLLIFGLFTLIRQMRSGPYHVFLSAAFAIVICMPLDFFIGLPLPGIEANLAEMKSKSEMYKNMTVENVYWVGFGLYTATGLMISLPVWIAALVVAIKSARKKS